MLEPAAPLPPPENDVVFETIEEPAVTNEAPLSDHDGIFSDKTRKAMEDTFANIEPEPVEAPRAAAGCPWPRSTRVPWKPSSSAPCARPSIRSCKNWLGTNADAIVERMKPLIREWMDEHFPALLEGAVRNEVARVVKARGTKR